MRILVVSACLLLATVFCDAADVTKYGPRSSTGDDAISDAVCSAGYVGITCRSDRDDYSDGGYFLNERTCRVRHRYAKPAVRAIVTCRRISECDDSTPKDIRSPTKDDEYTKYRQLSVTCPSTHYLTNCYFHSPWRQDSPSLRAYKSSNTCRTNRNCGSIGCSIQARCMPICDAADVTKYGPYSKTADDAISDAVCPAGYVGITCRCERVDYCDGGYFLNEKTCRIHNRYAKSRVRAIVTCRHFSDCDFSTPKDIRSPAAAGTYTKNRQLSVTCPSTHYLTNCYFHSPWMQALTNLRAYKFSNTCRTNRNCGSVGCSIQARCMPKTT